MPGEVFISYAREDTQFVRRIHAALAAQNRDAWVDWEDIPLTADWWREVQTGIEAAETFVFVISPDSAQSEVCYREIDHAAQHNKRIMPIMHREILDAAILERLHPAVNAHNWVFFRSVDDFDASFQALIDAMDTDLSYVREHTRLLVRARNWEASQHDSSQLLRDNELKAAETWLAGGLAKERNKPSDLHTAYIRQSRRAQNRRLQRMIVLSVLVALIIGLGGVSVLLRQEAEQKRDEAARNADLALAAQRDAEEQSQVSQAIGLAAQAQLELFGAFPERGVLLALEALEKLPYVWQADRALGAAVQVSRARSIFDPDEGPVQSVAWSPDGRHVATATGVSRESGSAIIWDAANGSEILKLGGHTDLVTSVAWSPEGEYLVTGSRDASVKLWDAVTGAELDTLFGHNEEWVNDVAWSPDGAYIATASNDDTTKLWSVADVLTAVTTRTADEGYTPAQAAALTTDASLTLVGHTSDVYAVDWSPDSAALVTVSNDRTIRIWDAADGTELRVFGDGTDGHTEKINAVDWSPDGTLILTGSNDNTAKVWDAATGDLRLTLKPHISDVTGVKFAPDSAMFATASRDRSIRVYDTATGEQLFTASGHADDVTGVDWSPSPDPNTRQLATSSEDGTARAWDGKPGDERLTLAGHEGRVTGAIWSPDGTRLITTGIDRIARVWDTQTGDELARIEGIRSGVNSAAWSPDATQIALISQDGTVQLRDAATGALQSTVETETTATSVAWSADGTQIITAIRADVVAWDAETGAELKRLEASGAIILAALDPGAQWLLTIANQDNRVTIWDFTTGQPAITFEQHVNDALDAAWSPDGLSVISGDADGTARVWDPFTGEERLALTGHTDSITGVAWSPTGARVLTASKDRTARVWDATTGSELLVLSGHTDELTDVGWSPPSEFGDRAVTASGDQTAKVWRVWENHDDLTRSARNCCVFRDLTPEERAQFNVPIED